LQCLPIGNPHRTESLLRYRPAPRTGPPSILIVTKLGEDAKYLDLAGQLDRHFDGRFRIQLRTNPRDQDFGRHSTSGRAEPSTSTTILISTHHFQRQKSS
jgi:hypothetical protein